MTIHLPSFLQIGWIKALITIVFVQAFINAIFTFKPLILLGVLMAEACILAVIYIVLALQSRRRPPLRGQNTAFLRHRRGLIFTVGGQDQTLRLSLDKQNPSFIGFICSAQSRDMARQLLEELNTDQDHRRIEEVDPSDIHDIKIKSGLILDWMKKKGLQPEDIAIDITGGTKAMSVGVFLVAEANQIDSQYIFCRQYVNNRCLDGTQEALLLSDFRKE